MVWQYINFQYLLHKKGTFTYSYSNPGVGRNQKMCCCWSQIAIDYMKFCINPLRLVSVPPPPPPLSPRTSSAPSFPSLVAYHHPVLTLTRGIQGCPKTISLNKNTWHPVLKKLLQTSFFLPLGVRTFLQHLLPKMLSLLHYSITQESFLDFSFAAAFSPFSNECQLFMPKDFLEPPCLTLLGVSLVYERGWKGGNR